MPPPQDILEGLTSIARVWHVVVGAGLLALGLGWRPAARVAALLLILPLFSVSVLAFATGNPFNGAVFAGLGVVLAGAALRMPASPVAIARPVLLIPAAALLAFGWVYPHFLDSPPWVYLYAAPLGLIPCPTLSAVSGTTVLLDGLRSRVWSAVLAAAGILYGVIGAVVLGVTIDIVLVAGAFLLSAIAATQGRSAHDKTPER